MEVIPAIDLMKGRVVRLSQGDPKTVKVYDYLGEPLVIAKKWEKDGANALHVIDLDAALNRGSNLAIISKIADTVNLPIQVGGGIRKLETAKDLLERGINRIILGALAFNEPHTLTKLRKKFGDKRIIVALDHQGGRVMVEGWKTSTKLRIDEALAKFSHFQVKTFLITSITKDGTLTGPDFNILSKAYAYPRINIIAAGGVSSLNDLTILKQIGVKEVVVGKALYEGIFTLKEALKVAKGDQSQCH